MGEVTANTNQTVVLSATDPSLVVESGVTVASTSDDGVYGDQSAVWSVVNNGTIDSTGPVSTFGVYLQGFGSKVANDGSIVGAGGVFFGGGGALVNAQNASIEATGSPAAAAATTVAGVDVEYGAGAIDNFGTISSLGYGVALETGGVVTNEATGAITGAVDAVYAVRGAVTVENYGKLTATAGDGVSFYNGGELINEMGGTVTAKASDASAARFSQFAGTLQNNGAMQGNEAGAYFETGGAVVNGAGNAQASLAGDDFGVYMTNIAGGVSAETVSNDGVITGGADGVFLAGNGGVVTNAGTIGGGSYSVDFAVASAANRLIVDPGAVFDGAVDGGGGTLELAGSSTATLAGSFQDFAVLQVDAGATWTLGGGVSAPALLLYGALTLTQNPSAGSISFGATATLIVATAAFSSPVLENFVAGDTIDLTDVASSGATISYDPTSGLATVSGGGKSVTLDFQASSLGPGTFQLTSDQGSGVDVSLASSTPSNPVTPPNPSGPVAPILEVSASQSSTLELAPPDTTAIIDAGVTVSSAADDGVYGNNLCTWTLTNDGVVNSGGANGTDGVYLQGPSSVVTNDGSISGSGGVYFGGGGTVINAANASIVSSGPAVVNGVAVIASVSGVDIEYGSGTVSNSGEITSLGYGVGLEDGGSVVNEADGTIDGAEDSIFIDRSYGTVDNYGALEATIDDGVGFFGGGKLTNEIGASITCLDTTGGTGPSAVFFSNFPGVLDNDGTMHGTESAAYFDMGGTLVNGANNPDALLLGDDIGVYMANAPGSTSAETITNYGVIEAGTQAGTAGVYVLGNGGTVTNGGTISGSAYSVDFAVSNVANRLIVLPGAQFNGESVGGGGVLELAGATPGLLEQVIGPTGDFTGFSQLQVDSGATWTLGGAVTVATIELNGALELGWTVSATAIVFGAAASLTVDYPDDFTSPLLENFSAGDVIDLKNVAFSGATISQGANGVATIVSGAQSVMLDFQASSLASGALQLASDGDGGVDVTFDASSPPPPPPPTVTITTAPTITAGTLTIAGTVTANDAATVAGQTVSLIVNGAVVETAIVGANGAFSANVALPNVGANSIVARVADSLGAIGTSAAVTDWLAATGATTDISLANATVVVDSGVSAAISGNGDTILVGAGAIVVAGGASDWIAISGDDGVAVASGADAVIVSSGAGDWAGLVGANQIAVANGAGDIVFSSGASSWTGLEGVNEVATATGSGDIVVADGASAWVNLNGAGEIATATGLGDVINANGASAWVNLNGAGEVATATGSNDVINANGASAWVNLNGADETATANGSNDVVNANAASAWVNLFGASETATAAGAGDVINATGASSWINLFGANDIALATGAGDVVNTTGASSWFSLGVSNETAIFGGGGATVVASAGGENLNFGQAFGQVAVSGYDASDQMTFSALDFANWSVFSSHVSQAGANTVIAFDASDSVTLQNVTATSLTQANVHFA